MSDLNKLFKDVWEKDIQENYSKGIINTEGCLQAHLYYFLRNRSELDNCEIWVVPTLYFDIPCQININRPDIIISLDSKIICIVELKYNIETGVNPYGDLSKLRVFSEQAGINSLPLKIDPNTGKCNTGERFTISENVLCVFAVIAHKASDALYKDRWNEIKLPNNFLHLTGKVTGSGYFFN